MHIRFRDIGADEALTIGLFVQKSVIDLPTVSRLICLFSELLILLFFSFPVKVHSALIYIVNHSIKNDDIVLESILFLLLRAIRHSLTAFFQGKKPSPYLLLFFLHCTLRPIMINF